MDEGSFHVLYPPETADGHKIYRLALMFYTRAGLRDANTVGTRGNIYKKITGSCFIFWKAAFEPLMLNCG